MKNCYIEGSVDFIFGRDIVLFDSCEIHINRNGGTLTAASTDADSKFGYIFLDNVLSADPVGFDGDTITSFYLGRPWQAEPKTVFINTYEPASLNPAAWLAWNVTPAVYAEYNCSGPGYSDLSQRASFSSQLTSDEAAQYTIQNIFAMESNPRFGYDWIPVKPILTSVESDFGAQIPTEYNLYQNFPNPFNPTTTIRFAVPKESHVVLDIYNIVGQKVMTLINKNMKAGLYNLDFDASHFSSGVYIYRINPGKYSATKKMMLLK